MPRILVALISLLALSLLPLSADAHPSNKWRLQFSGGELPGCLLDKSLLFVEIYDHLPLP